MARVPYEGGVPTVAPAATPPEDYQRIQATPAEFGAQVGQGAQALGQGAEQAGEFYASVAATHAANDFLDYSDKLLHGDPNDPSNPGLMNLRGQDAMRAYQPAMQQIEARRQQAMEGLPPIAQQEFSRQTLYLDRWARNAAAGYARQAQTEWAAEGAKDQGDLALRKYTEATIAGDTQTQGQLVHMLRDSQVKLDQAKFGTLSPEMQQAAVDRADGMAAVAGVDALARTDPLRAQRMLDANIGVLPGPVYDRLSGEVQRAQQRQGVEAGIADTWSRFGGAGPPAAGTNAAMPGGAIAGAIAAEAQRRNVDPTTALATAQIESGMGRNLGERGNIFQLGAPEWQSVGGGTMGDPATDIRNGVAFLGNTAAQLEQRLGRAPTGAETYLAHQQGVEGALALLTHPDEPAGMLVPAAHIAANGGDPNAPASQFTAKWQNAYDHSAAQFGAGATPADPSGTPAPAQAAPLPDLDGMLADVESRVGSGALTPDQGNAMIAGLRARYHLVEAQQATGRAALATQLTNGMAQLQDGGDFDYDPAQIRHFFPPEQAAALVQKLDDARQAGQVVAGVRIAAPADIALERDRLAAGLDDPTATDYLERRKQLGVFDSAVADRNKQLAGPQADPASYLARYDPVVAAARQRVDPADPASFASYATAALTEQSRLGVPPAQQHILSRPVAGNLAGMLTGDPEHAPATMQSLAQQYGQAWPNAWHDIVTLGRLPAAFEAVGTLPDQQDAALLARALGEITKNPGKTWGDLIGKPQFAAMQQQVRSDPDMDLFKRSLENQPGMSAAKAEQLLGAVDTLASARSVYLGDTNAAGNAVKAFTGAYSFSLPGGPRVPAANARAVSANAAGALDRLAPDTVAVPDVFGSSPASPTAEDYVDLLKTAPNWVNAPKGDALWLMDPQGRIVRDRAGQPIAVPFAAPMPAFGGPDLATPTAVPY